MVSDPPTPTEMFFVELGKLYEAAGSPKHAVLIRRGEDQIPQVKLNDATLSGWFTGKAVPADWAAVRFLVEFLQARAERTGYKRRSLSWWQNLHQQAQEHQQSGRGGRSSQRLRGAGRVRRELGDGARSGNVPDTVPHQLPAVPVDFTGRQREVGELVTYCTAGSAAISPLVISGLAGVGKSALALRLAHELVSRYPDGQLYGAMRGPSGPIPAEVTLARFLRALGTPLQAVPTDLAEQASAYRSRLAGKRVLVVLDDAGSAQQVEPLVPGDPSCLVVVTSRNPLPAVPSALTYTLGLLELAESLELLSTIAGASRMADVEAGQHIVELCGRLPLALRIAAARLRSRTDWTPGDLVARLSDMSRRLRELRVGDLDVRASFELSYQDLPPEFARLFRRLAIVPGTTFSSELAAVLSGTPQPDTDEFLDRLVLDQMLEPAGNPNRYRMHPLMRVLAHELFSQDTKAEINSALNATFQWYGENLGAFGEAAVMRIQPPDKARTWLDAEESNLIPILVGSEQLSYDQYTALIAIPVAAAARSRALWAEWKQAIDLGLAAAERLGERKQQALLLYELADHQYRWGGDADAAATSLSEALTRVDSSEMPALIASARYRLAQLHQKAGHHAEAEKELAAAVAAAALTDDPTAGRIVDEFRAEALVDQGKFEEAIALLAPLSRTWAKQGVMVEFEQRMLLAKAYLRGDDLGVSAYTSTPQTSADQRRLKAARLELKQCRQLCSDHGVRVHAPKVYLMTGQVYRALGSHRRAQQAWKEGLALFDNAGYTYDPSMAGRLAYELANEHAQAGEHTLASDGFGRAAQDFQDANQFVNRAGALDRQAQEKLALDDHTRAIAAWKAALAGLDQAEDQDEAAKVRKLLLVKLRRATGSSGG